MIQEYSAKNFARSFRKSDIQRFELTGVEVYEYLNSQATRCVIEKNLVNGIKISKDKKIHYIDKKFPHEHLMVRHCSKVIQNLHNISFPDRSNTIKFLKKLLVESLDSGDTSIHRFDLKSFYESIKKDNVQYIMNDSRLESNIKATLNSVYKNKNKLIRGISLTAVIAEKYMIDFDYRIKMNNDVLYYFRYVDDIFIITKNSVEESIIKKLVESNLPDGLHLNEDKHSYMIVKDHKISKFYSKKDNFSGVYFYSKKNKNIFLDFLGYKFIFYCDSKIKVKIGISESKKSNIKRKMVRSFFKYNIDKDFEMLLSRINYLCSNVRIISNRKLYSGIYYNYSLIDFNYSQKSGAGFDDLLDIHRFLQSIIFGSNKHPSLSEIKLTKSQISQLRRISILSGFKDKRVLKLSNDKISKIKGAWFNV